MRAWCVFFLGVEIGKAWRARPGLRGKGGGVENFIENTGIVSKSETGGTQEKKRGRASGGSLGKGRVASNGEVQERRVSSGHFNKDAFLETQKKNGKR